MKYKCIVLSRWMRKNILALVDRDVVVCIVCVYVCYVCVPRRRCILWQQCSNGRIGGVVRVVDRDARERARQHGHRSTSNREYSSIYGLVVAATLLRGRGNQLIATFTQKTDFSYGHLTQMISAVSVSRQFNTKYRDMHAAVMGRLQLYSSWAAGGKPVCAARWQTEAFLSSAEIAIS